MLYQGATVYEFEAITIIIITIDLVILVSVLDSHAKDKRYLWKCFRISEHNNAAFKNFKMPIGSAYITRLTVCREKKDFLFFS